MQEQGLGIELWVGWLPDLSWKVRVCGGRDMLENQLWTERSKVELAGNIMILNDD